MRFLVSFTAFHWDNYQGATGVYQNHTIEVEFNGDSSLVWQKIHDSVKSFLENTRAFNQTVYSKKVGEYTIQKAELL